MPSILFLLLLFGVVYFLMIRPQQKRRREAQQMQSSLTAGDRIVTIGGLHATIVAIDGDVATLEIAPGVQVQFASQAISRKLPVADDTVADEPAVEEPAVDEPVQNPVVDRKD